MKIRLIAGLVLLSCSVQAQFSTDWDNWFGVTTQTDAVDVLDDYRDIRAVNHYYDGSDYHYFRMVFEGGSGTDLILGATDYMINIDSAPGGQSAATSLYLASGLAGIDQIVDVHMGGATLFSNAQPGHDHYSSDGANGTNINFTIAGLASFGGDAQGGTSYLEWKVPKNILPVNSFTIYGSSLTIGGSTFDTTAGIQVVPEPATFSLIALASAVVCILTRRFDRFR